MEVLYDPKQVSYEELLEVLWDSHNPASHSMSRQYMPAIFYYNEEQRRAAEVSKAAKARELGVTVRTQVLPVVRFYPAEDYHQKYYLRHNRMLMREFRRMYPDEGHFRDSTAAARVNALLGSYGSADTYLAELEQYGLTAHARNLLEQKARRLKPVTACGLLTE